MYIKTEIKIHNDILNIEAGKIARNTASSVMLNIDGTTMLVSVVYTIAEEADFLPLKVDYFERFYASGKIPFNYFKREGKPSEREILISRLIDRSIRAMFPKNLGYEIQLTITVLSINHEINPDIIAINGASIALAMSGIQFSEIAAIRIGFCDNSILINPKSSEMKKSNAELILVGSDNKIIMLEGNFNELTEENLINCINMGLNTIGSIITSIKEIKKLTNNNLHKEKDNENVSYQFLTHKYEIIFNDLYLKSIHNKETIKKLKTDLINKVLVEESTTVKKHHIINFFNYLEKKIIRHSILESNIRVDNRLLTEIRSINSEINFLRSTHGSALFTRGETQSIATITLGTHKDSQLVDCPFFSCYKKNFILHYNFPPYAVNEISSTNIIKRREIGHGNLARSALTHIIPTYDEFPYVIRIVSEITESNGSSSMATVCSSSLALMDSGVPIKHHVAGVAMGLIKENEKYVILTDISSDEDFFGDMDFKLTGTINGITAIQMDLKIPGIDLELIKKIITEAISAIKKIIDIMNTVIEKPKDKIPDNAPKIKILHVNKNKIKDIIGKNGAIIKDLIEKYECEINISNDGVIRVSANSQSSIELVVNDIRNLIKEIKIGMTCKGRVMRLVQFGAFINITNKTDGLLHISKINKHRISNQNWEIKEGDILDVTISSIDTYGKISLNINE